MRKVSKALALLLALMMIVTSMPMSVFAEAGAAAAKTFDLVIDDDGDDEDVTYPDDMGEAPSGEALYDGVTPAGLKLDWDSWTTIFGSGSDVVTASQDITFVLNKKTAVEAVASPGDVEGVAYSDLERIAIISDSSKVKVLNVYPIPASEGLLCDWLNLAYQDHKYGKSYTDDFEIDTVLQDRRAAEHAGVEYTGPVFNEDYEEILAKGNYDVIFFGTSDGNGDLYGVKDRTFYDLSKGAYEAVDQFIKDGHGVLFGHDTVCSADHLEGVEGDYDGFDYFTEFADELGIVCLEGADQTAATSQRSNEVTGDVKVTNKGLLTSYPFTIDENLTVPQTHSLLQKVPAGSSATVWMKLQDSDGDGKYYLGDEFSAYLLTNNNVAMIQTGHSSNADGISTGATKQEGQVIANTLFYLMQKSINHYSTDGDFVDSEAPVIEDNGKAAAITDLAPTDGTMPQYFKADIEVSASDLGTAYDYFVEAKINNRTEATSNEVKVLAISNLKGYMVEITESDALIGADTMKADRLDSSDKSNRNIIVDVESEGAPQSETITFNTGDVKSGKDGLEVVPGKSYYAHIIPVDNANNCGNEIVVEINFEDLYNPNVETDVIPTVSGTDTIPEDSRVEVVTSTDAAGNTTTETTTYYYPGNYKDKDGKPFDKDSDNVPYEADDRQEDEEVVVNITASVDTLERKDIIGVITLTKKDEDKPGETEFTLTGEELADVIKGDMPDLDGVTYEDGVAEKIVFDIDKIYINNEDYDGDGEYTVTVTWYEKAKDEDGSFKNEPNLDKPVATDTAEFVIVQPDYKVEFKYKDTDKDGKLEEKTETKIVKYNGGTKAPSIKKTVVANGYKYIFQKWDKNTYKKNVTSDQVIIAEYDQYVDKPAQPTKPTTQPTQPSLPKDDIDFIRLGGETRIETAIEISKEGWKDGAKVVILATANQFPDAMAGVPLAKAVDAPILLTINGEKLEEIVKAEIARLNPEKVYILGQTDAVNANIEKELDALYEVERVGGKDRFGTAAEIAYEMEEVYGEKADAVYFVRSDLFPDALSVSSVAALEHNPILYVAPDGKLTYDTVKYANSIGTKATIVGGPEAVNAVGEENVKTLFKSVDRIYGKDRYATSVEVCTAKNALFTGKATALATGKKFPDALTGGSFAAKNSIPVLLVNGSVSPELAKYLSNRPINTLYVFGGQLAVSDQVAYQALGYCVSYSE